MFQLFNIVMKKSEFLYMKSWKADWYAESLKLY